MEFKQGEMYKVVLAYSMNDELFTYPITLIGKCLLSNEKYATLLDPLTNFVQGFKLSQVSTAEPYEASTASVKPETSSVAGKSSVPSVAKSTTGTTGTTDAPPKTPRAETFLMRLGAANTRGLTRRQRDLDPTEEDILRAKIQSLLEANLPRKKSFDENLTKDLGKLFDMVKKTFSVDKGKPSKSNVVPIVKTIVSYISYDAGNFAKLKEQVLGAYIDNPNLYLLTDTSFIDTETYNSSSFKIPTRLFVFSSKQNIMNLKLL